jgi:hypothetical protein
MNSVKKKLNLTIFSRIATYETVTQCTLTHVTIESCRL